MNLEQQKYEKKRLEMCRYLNRTKEEIERLEKQINDIKVKNKRNNRISNLKVSLRVIQCAYPYILSTGIIFGAFKWLGMTPFGNNTEKEYLNTMKEFDSLGNVRYEHQYDDYKSSNFISYYSKWEQQSDGTYKRNINNYNLKELTEDEILEIFNKENVNIEDIFGEVIAQKSEIKNNLSYEELNKGDFLQATIYSKSKDEYIVIKCDTFDNIGIIIAYLLAIVVSICCVSYTREKWFNYDFSKKIDYIKEKYPKTDVLPYIKQLEIKKNNYDRLTR